MSRNLSEIYPPYSLDIAGKDAKAVPVGADKLILADSEDDNSLKSVAIEDLPGGDMENPMTTAGDMIVGGVEGAPARLAKGAALQVLRMNADATAQEYADPEGGDDDYEGTNALVAKMLFGGI
jgi:hypothetical protein